MKVAMLLYAVKIKLYDFHLAAYNYNNINFITLN